jgi:hypothetical protein
MSTHRVAPGDMGLTATVPANYPPPALTAPAGFVFAPQVVPSAPGRQRPASQIKSPFLETKEAALFMRLSARTLEQLRHQGRGPDYYSFGKNVLYRRRDLLRWAETQLRRMSPSTEAPRPEAS